MKNSRIFVALDTHTITDARTIVHMMPDGASYKIGSRFILSPMLLQLISFIKLINSTIFLDFKLFDIDETVRETVEKISDMGVHYTTVHANVATMKAAVSGATNGLKILAVTLLTSMNESDIHEHYNYDGDINELVLRRTRLARECGCAGVIASPNEVKIIRDNMPDDFLIVCPGVRMNNDSDEHKRVGTPKQAIMDGADYLVIGRPIIKAINPRKIFNEIINSI